MEMADAKDLLIQAMEARVWQVRKEWNEQREQAYDQELEKKTERMNQIRKKLPAEDSAWLDQLWLDRLDLLEGERERLYRAGMLDALRILDALKH